MNERRSTCEPLKQVIYISNTTADFSDDALTTLLLQARRNNALDSISGVLIHHGKCFVQCIEGPASAIDRLFARIARDPRHTNVITLLERSIEQRSFPGWHMGCTRVDESQYLQLANSRWERINDDLPESPGVNFLLNFWDNGRHQLF